MRNLTGVKNFTKYHKINTENCKRIRETIRIYVRQRNNNENSSKVLPKVVYRRGASYADGADLLNLFLRKKDFYTEDLIIDELIEFLLASQTNLSHIMQTFLVHCAHDPKSV